MEKKFKQDENWIKIIIFRKIINIRHNFEIDFKHPLKPRYSCYDICLLRIALKDFFTELFIESIILWIEENCIYLKEDNKNKEGKQFSLF